MSWRWGRRRSRSRYYDSYWPPYVPVAERREKARVNIARLVKKGEALDPVVIEGSRIARTFWGKAWCDHLENHCDWSNRLPRGRSYVRNGAVCDLKIGPGLVEARVAGTRLYKVEVRIKKIPPVRWKAIREASTGGIASVIELLRGRLSGAVMAVMTHPTDGLFPRRKEIEFKCSCPDYAIMCKHVAAALYGVGARLDDRPELLFVLRGVDHTGLIDEAVRSEALVKPAAGPAQLAEGELSEIFGVEIETGGGEKRAAAGKKARPGLKGKKKKGAPGKEKRREGKRINRKKDGRSVIAVPKAEANRKKIGQKRIKY